MTDARVPPIPADARKLADWLAGARERAVERARAEPRAGRAAARELSAGVDALAAALAGKVLGAGGDWALVALGEWGRGELAPASPLELGVLCGQGAPVGELVSALSSAGLDVTGGILVHEQIRKRLSEEASAIGDFLPVRRAAGSEDLFASLREDIEAAVRARGRAAVDAAVSAALERQEAEGGSVCRVEPDLIANPGGLADFLCLEWVEEVLGLAGLGRAGRGLLDEEDLDEARDAASFLTGCRVVLHGLAGARRERLEADGQVRLAAALGYRSDQDLDARGLLMRDVFRAMRAVHRAFKAAAAQYEEERSWGSRRQTVDRRRRLADGMIRIGKRLYLSRPDLFEGRDAGLRMLRGFAQAASSRLGLSQEFLKRVRDNLYMVGDDLRASPEAANLFMEIFRVRGGSAEVLRAMHESGFLGAYLPEFGQIDCLAAGSPGHRYTADEHSLMVVAEIDHMEMAPVAGSAAGGAAEMAGTGIVKLAGLLHAVGASRGPAGFAERGAVMLPRIAGQLGLSEEEARTVIFLVEHQDLLAEASGSRMTTDRKLLDDLAERVEYGERLDELYLLTLADGAALARGAFPPWRARQLTALHDRLAARLAARPAGGGAALADGLKGRLPEGVSAADAERHLELVPERYLLEVGAADAALHLALLAGMGGPDDAAVDWRRAKDHVHFWILGPDRPRRISQLAGALLAGGASIVSARAYTRKDGIIIDAFDVVPAADPASPGADDFWRAAAGTVRDVLTGRADLDELLAEMRARPSTVGSAPKAGTQWAEPRVSFDNDISADYTVVDVACSDRVGLLHALSAGLSEAGADIAFAKITTVGGAARDVFYVTMNGAKVAGREDRRRIRSAVLAAWRGL